jgi:hypothetical protein
MGPVLVIGRWTPQLPDLVNGALCLLFRCSLVSQRPSLKRVCELIEFRCKLRSEGLIKLEQDVVAQFVTYSGSRLGCARPRRGECPPNPACEG